MRVHNKPPFVYDSIAAPPSAFSIPTPITLNEGNPVGRTFLCYGYDLVTSIDAGQVVECDDHEHGQRLDAGDREDVAIGDSMREAGHEEKRNDRAVVRQSIHAAGCHGDAMGRATNQIDIVADSTTTTESSPNGEYFRHPQVVYAFGPEQHIDCRY